MGLGDQIKTWLGRSQPIREDGREMVPFLNTETGVVVDIPAAELAPGAVRVRLQPDNRIVWTLPEGLRPGPMVHAPFDDEIRAFLKTIRDAFFEHRPLSLYEWEDGFRRDQNAEREIALWLHAADNYDHFARAEPDPARRAEIYRVVIACLTTSPETVKNVLAPDRLTRDETWRIVGRFYGKPT